MLVMAVVAPRRRRYPLILLHSTFVQSSSFLPLCTLKYTTIFLQVGGYVLAQFIATGNKICVPDPSRCVKKFHM